MVVFIFDIFKFKVYFIAETRLGVANVSVKRHRQSKKTESVSMTDKNSWRSSVLLRWQSV